MPKKTKKNRKLYFMILWLLLVGVLFGSSTYAWFSTNRVVYISSLNVNVRAEGGIEISADAQKWKTILAIQDLIDAHTTSYPTSTNQIPNRLEPVSTGKQINQQTGFLNMYHGLVEIDALANYILESNKIVEEESSGDVSEGKFIAFDIFLKTTSPTDLYLTTSSGATSDEENSVGIENSARIAFLIEGNASENTSLNTIQTLKGVTNDTVYIWEPNYDTHTEEAVEHALSTYNIITTTTNADALDYDGIIQEFNKTENITVEKANNANYPNYFKKVNVDYLTKKNPTENSKIFSISSGITKIRIYMWIEGQDVDCEDNASIGNFTFNLQFTTNKK